MAGLTEFYCRSNETSHGSQFKWLDNTFKIRIPCRHSLLTISLLSGRSLFNLCSGSPSVHFLFTLSSLSLKSLFTLSSTSFILFSLCFFSVHSLKCLFTLCSLCLLSVYFLFTLSSLSLKSLFTLQPLFILFSLCFSLLTLFILCSPAHTLATNCLHSVLSLVSLCP
jgi:hypothetical protein